MLNHSQSPSSVAPPVTITPKKKMGSRRRRNSKPVEFSPQHQRAINEHLSITRNQPHRHYAHVPCKFFRQNACQAGNSCPFSHSLDVQTADQRPCEYYRRGHCKFGERCANAHIPPDQNKITPAQDDYDDDVFPSEEYYIPQEVSELLTPEERRRRRSSGASSGTSSLSLSSASSLSASLSLAPVRGSPWSPKMRLDPTLWNDAQGTLEPYLQPQVWYGGFSTSWADEGKSPHPQESYNGVFSN